MTLDTVMAPELTPEQISAMRRAYGDKGIDELPSDPFAFFSTWLEQAHKNPAIVEANAMVLSTQDHNGTLSTRTVLLKDISASGFTFFTNYTSRKALAMHSNPHVTLLFPWYPLERQVIISGEAEKISRSESEEYFATRPWNSQIGAWASQQSSPLSSRAELEERWKSASEKWPEGSRVPTPPHWGGYRVNPSDIEFWQGRYSRLHDRVRFERRTTSSTGEINWEISRYYP